MMVRRKQPEKPNENSLQFEKHIHLNTLPKDLASGKLPSGQPLSVCRRHDDMAKPQIDILKHTTNLPTTGHCMKRCR